MDGEVRLSEVNALDPRSIRECQPGYVCAVLVYPLEELVPECIFIAKQKEAEHVLGCVALFSVGRGYTRPVVGRRL
ncbi:hypothetical protein SRHO_G00014190 [Serrasalmus rhombeus]